MAASKSAATTKSADASKAGKGKAVKNAEATLKGSLNTGTKLASVPGGTKTAKPAKAPAAAKPAKAPKAAKEPGDARSAYDTAAKIQVLKADHTFREGSIRGESFAAMKKAKTVGDYIQGGGLTKHLTRFSDAGLIKIG